MKPFTGIAGLCRKDLDDPFGRNAARGALHMLGQALFPVVPAKVQPGVFDCHISAVKRPLADTELLVREIGMRVRYPDPFHFCWAFMLNAGMNPSEYRKWHMTRKTDE